MFKLLIVDDEILDREGIRDQFQWDKLGITGVETARNGFEALEIMARYQPDILISDVKMPGMNGLDLAARAIELVPLLKIIFISGYDDFEFVKSALKINAYEYILKPVDDNELLRALKQAVSERLQEIRHEEENRRLLDKVNEGKELLRNRFLNDLVYGTVEKSLLWSSIASLDINIQEGRYCVLLCEIDDSRTLYETLSATEFEKMAKGITTAIRNLKNHMFYIEPFQLDQARYAVILSCNSYVDMTAVPENIKSLSKDMIDDVSEKFGISMTVGIGRTVESMEELGLSYDEGCRALDQKMYAGKGTVLCYRPKTSLREGTVDVQKVAEQLTQCIRSRDINRACSFLDYFFDSMETGSMLDGKYVQNCCINIISRIEILLLDMNEKMEDIFGEQVLLWDKLLRFETILDIRQWMKNVLRAIVEHLENKNERKNRKIVEAVLQYIEANYSKEITLKDIALQLYYSPNYLGALFKDEVGQGFSEYLTEYRMKKAAGFIKRPDLKMYEIAYSVGYKNIPSFINQFKQSHGMTPTEYRERY